MQTALQKLALPYSLSPLYGFTHNPGPPFDRLGCFCMITICFSFQRWIYWPHHNDVFILSCITKLLLMYFASSETQSSWEKLSFHWAESKTVNFHSTEMALPFNFLTWPQFSFTLDQIDFWTNPLFAHSSIVKTAGSAEKWLAGMASFFNMLALQRS